MGYIAEGEIDKIKILAAGNPCQTPCDVGLCFLCQIEGHALCNGGSSTNSCQQAARKWLAENDTQEKPVTAFEVGKWYKWVGPKEHQLGWNTDMDYMLDGLPHKCIETDSDRCYADFEDHPRGYCWTWKNFDGNFREVPAPTEPMIHSAGDYATGGMVATTFTMPAKDAKFILSHLMKETEREREARLLATIKTKN